MESHTLNHTELMSAVKSFFCYYSSMKHVNNRHCASIDLLYSSLQGSACELGHLKSSH